MGSYVYLPAPKSNALKLTLLLFLAPLFVGCGGVKEEAQVATSLQTMMVLAVEAAIRYNLDNVAAGTGPLDCYKGGTYEPINANLANLIDFITGQTDTAQVSGQFLFSDCKIPLCGKTITLNGSADFDLETEIASTNRRLNLIFSSNDTNFVESRGIINDSPRFDYKMSVDVTESTLGDITISEANPAKPMTYKGKIYRAAYINELAEGC